MVAATTAGNGGGDVGRGENGGGEEGDGEGTTIASCGRDSYDELA